MQITQAEIILSFRPNYIPYISGASWGFFPPSSVSRRLLLLSAYQVTVAKGFTAVLGEDNLLSVISSE